MIVLGVIVVLVVALAVILNTINFMGDLK